MRKAKRTRLDAIALWDARKDAEINAAYAAAGVPVNDNLHSRRPEPERADSQEHGDGDTSLSSPVEYVSFGLRSDSGCECCEVDPSVDDWVNRIFQD